MVLRQYISGLKTQMQEHKHILATRPVDSDAWQAAFLVRGHLLRLLAQATRPLSVRTGEAQLQELGAIAAEIRRYEPALKVAPVDTDFATYLEIRYPAGPVAHLGDWDGEQWRIDLYPTPDAVADSRYDEYHTDLPAAITEPVTVASAFFARMKSTGFKTGEQDANDDLD